jgi:hypothetical protein
MGVFSSIRDAIFGKAKAQGVPAPTTAPAAPAPSAPIDKTIAKQAGAATRHEVDVEAVLDAMAGANQLNWRTSIVDLMKLVGMDASFAERRELAMELGDADYHGTVDENIRLHRQLMEHLAVNGGRVPASLLD